MNIEKLNKYIHKVMLGLHWHEWKQIGRFGSSYESNYVVCLDNECEFSAKNSDGLTYVSDNESNPDYTTSDGMRVLVAEIIKVFEKDTGFKISYTGEFLTPIDDWGPIDNHWWVAFVRGVMRGKGWLYYILNPKQFAIDIAKERGYED